MAAKLLGDVGIWAIASDEVSKGMIIEKIDDTSKKKTKDLLNHRGERIGRSDYDESMEISLSAKLTALTPFSQKLSGDLVMNNAILATHLTGTGGRTLIDEVKRSRSQEDWVGVDVDAELLPYYAAAA